MSDSPLTHASLIARLLEYADAADGRFQERALDCDYEALTRDLHKAAALLADTRAAQSDDDEASFVAWELAHQRTIGRVLTSEEHAIAESAWMSADTRAATEGSEPLSSRFQELFWALPQGEMRSKLRALENDIGIALRQSASSAPTRETGWQSIESAPKNTPVIIGGGGCPRVHENYLQTSRFHPDGVWGGLGDKQQPTLSHPMPSLPAPPRDERPQTGEREG